MKRKKAIYTALSMQLIALCGLSSQTAFPATGGNAAGSGGSVSYSVGQIDYIAGSSANGSASQGVQQPYEIFTVGTDEAADITLRSSLYPNPTSGGVTLSVPRFAAQPLRYQLFDAAGRLLSDGGISGADTGISLAALPAATYLLSVRNPDRAIKTFKIIKY